MRATCTHALPEVPRFGKLFERVVHLPLVHLSNYEAVLIQPGNCHIMSFSTFSSLRAMATNNGTKDAKVALITGITGQGLLFSQDLNEHMF